MNAQFVMWNWKLAMQFVLIATAKWELSTNHQFVKNVEDSVWRILASSVFKARHRLILAERFVFTMRNLRRLLRRLSITEIHFAGNLWQKK
jgi:hypothetical protein